MTATEELRRLLDGRGVEWWSEDDQEEPAYYFITKWFANGCEQAYEEIPAIRSRSLKAYCLTPEQAIAATLGVEECTLESAHGYCDPYVRTAYQIELSCHTLDAWDDPVPPSYCPYCGKRVVKEDA
jgi:hypothetical protein